MLSEAQCGDIQRAEELIEFFAKLEHVDNEMLIELARSSAVIASHTADDVVAERILQKR